MLTVVDLFCGCGGMSWGLHKAGFHILAGIDNAKRPLETFQLNHPQALAIEADIAQLDAHAIMKQLNLVPGELDCLVGGPPCQGFSKNVPAAYRFLADPRNQLFREFLRFVDVLQPKVVIMENVAEIYNAYHGEVRAEIIETLQRSGYTVNVQVLYAPDFGIPQRRKRCIFFASRAGEPIIPPAISHELVSAWEALSDLPVLQNGDGYEPMAYAQLPLNTYQAKMRATSYELYDHVTRRLNEKQFSRVSALAAGQGMKDLPVELQAKSGYSGAYGRLDFTMLAPTITRWVFHPGSGRFCHPREARLITIREAARLQSFSDDFRFTGSYIEKSHQVGNAVPPLLMEALAPAIKACLTSAAVPQLQPS